MFELAAFSLFLYFALSFDVFPVSSLSASFLNQDMPCYLSIIFSAHDHNMTSSSSSLPHVISLNATQALHNSISDQLCSSKAHTLSPSSLVFNRRTLLDTPSKKYRHTYSSRRSVNTPTISAPGSDFGPPLYFLSFLCCLIFHSECVLVTRINNCSRKPLILLIKFRAQAGEYTAVRHLKI